MTCIYIYNKFGNIIQLYLSNYNRQLKLVRRLQLCEDVRCKYSYMVPLQLWWWGWETNYLWKEKDLLRPQRLILPLDNCGQPLHNLYHQIIMGIYMWYTCSFKLHRSIIDSVNFHCWSQILIFINWCEKWR